LKNKKIKGNPYGLGNLKAYSAPEPFRLLTVDNHLMIPTRLPVRLLVASADVIHS